MAYHGESLQVVLAQDRVEAARVSLEEMSHVVTERLRNNFGKGCA